MLESRELWFPAMAGKGGRRRRGEKEGSREEGRRSSIRRGEGDDEGGVAWRDCEISTEGQRRGKQAGAGMRRKREGGMTTFSRTLQILALLVCSCSGASISQVQPPLEPHPSSPETPRHNLSMSQVH